MSLTKASYSMIYGSVVNFLDHGADSTGNTNCYAAFISAIDATPIGGTLYIPEGKFKLTQRLTITKAINIAGEGKGSVIWLDVGAAEVGIEFGTSGAYTNGVTWRDFAILGAANSCLVSLLLLKVNTSVFDNVHIWAGTAATGKAVWIRWAIENYYNFILSANVAYPYAGSAPYNGVFCSSNAGTGEVCNANTFNLNISGPTNGLYINTAAISDGGNNYITGVYQGIGGYGINLVSCKAAVLQNCHVENATNIGANYILLTSCNFVQLRGVSSFSFVIGFNDVQLVDSYATYIDGLRCNRLSIDAGSLNTYILGASYQGNTDAGLYDLGALTNQFVTPKWSIQGANIGGTPITGPDFAVDTNVGNATVTFGRLSGTAGDNTKVIFRNRIGVKTLGIDTASIGLYANNAAALAAGLVVGDMYRIGDTLAIVH